MLGIRTWNHRDSSRAPPPKGRTRPASLRGRAEGSIDDVAGSRQRNPAKTPSRRQSKMLSKQRTGRGGGLGGWNTNQHHTLCLLVRTGFVGYVVNFLLCCVMGLDSVHVIVGVGSAGGRWSGGFLVTYMESARWPSGRAALWLAWGWHGRRLVGKVEIVVFAT